MWCFLAVFGFVWFGFVCVFACLGSLFPMLPLHLCMPQLSLTGAQRTDSSSASKKNTGVRAAESKDIFGSLCSGLCCVSRALGGEVC